MKKIFLIISSILLLTSLSHATRFYSIGLSSATISGNFVSKTGDTMSGDLNLPNLNATGIVDALTLTDGTLTINSGQLLSGVTVESDIGNFNTIYVHDILVHK